MVLGLAAGTENPANPDEGFSPSEDPRKHVVWACRPEGKD
jgi:hypothetical protein